MKCEEENLYFAALPSRRGLAAFWIGITDRAKEGEWRTFNGELATYFGPPFTARNGDYGLTSGSKSNNAYSMTYRILQQLDLYPEAEMGQWGDASGAHERPSYCTFEANKNQFCINIKTEYAVDKENTSYIYLGCQKYKKILIL